MSETINSRLSFEPYNSRRSDLIIREYGRNVQRMVNHALSIDDREERNKCVRAILSVMGQLFPHLRDIEDFNHKLWDHLHIMSKFKLDVDSPYPVPDPEHLESKPDKIPYPQNRITFGHYGHYVEKLVAKCAALEDGEEKKAFGIAIAQLMKYQANNWNRNIVYDEVIIKDLQTLSKGGIIIEDPNVLSGVKVTPINKFKDFESDTMMSKKKKFVNNKNKKFKKKPRM
jgi:Domain of unknown function (DUF4290)